MRLLLLAAASALAVPAYASEMSDWPQPLADAFSAGYEAPEDAIWRFTLDIVVNDERMQVRFDGSQPDGSDYVLLYPESPDSLEGELADFWADMSSSGNDEDDDGQAIGQRGLFLNGETQAMVSGGVRALDNNRYAFDPDLDPASDDDAEMAGGLDGEVTLSDTGQVQRVRIFAPESFKPHPVARIHEFEMLLEYTQLEGMPAPTLASMTTVIEVSAMFQRQEQAMRFSFSDVEYLEP